MKNNIAFNGTLKFVKAGEYKQARQLLMTSGALQESEGKFNLYQGDGTLTGEDVANNATREITIAGGAYMGMGEVINDVLALASSGTLLSYSYENTRSVSVWINGEMTTVEGKELLQFVKDDPKKNELILMPTHTLMNQYPQEDISFQLDMVLSEAMHGLYKSLKAA